MTESVPDSTPVHRSRGTAPRLSAAGAALFGVVVGGVFSIAGVMLTNHAFDERTQRDFLHQQRQTAIAALLSDEHQTTAEELTVSISLNPDGSGFGSVVQPYSALVTKLITDAEEIRLVADDHIYQLALTVAGDHGQILIDYVHVAQCRQVKASSCPSDTDLQQKDRQLTSDTQALVQAGQQAIGAR